MTPGDLFLYVGAVVLALVAVPVAIGLVAVLLSFAGAFGFLGIMWVADEIKHAIRWVSRKLRR